MITDSKALKSCCLEKDFTTFDYWQSGGILYFNISTDTIRSVRGEVIDKDAVCNAIQLNMRGRKNYVLIAGMQCIFLNAYINSGMFNILGRAPIVSQDINEENILFFEDVKSYENKFVYIDFDFTIYLGSHD